MQPRRSSQVFSFDLNLNTQFYYSINKNELKIIKIQL